MKKSGLGMTIAACVLVVVWIIYKVATKSWSGITLGVVCFCLGLLIRKQYDASRGPKAPGEPEDPDAPRL